MIIHMLLEGHMEEPLARKLIRHCGHEPGAVYGKKGCNYIHQNARNFVFLANSTTGVLILSDFMDSKCSCPPQAYRLHFLRHCKSVPPNYLCRFVVNELESWLMADRRGLAAFLGIPIAKVPVQPELEDDPKHTLVELARASKKRQIREALAPPPGHGGAVGPGYTPTLIEFIIEKWSPEKAEQNAPSLARCLKRLRELPNR